MANCKARHAECRCPNCRPLVFDAPSCTVRWRCTQCKLFEPYNPYDPKDTGLWYHLKATPLPDAPAGVREFDYGYVKLRGEVAAIPYSRYTLTVGGGGCAERKFQVDTPNCECGHGCGYNAFNDYDDESDLGPPSGPFATSYGLIWDARDQATLIISGLTDQERFLHADGTNGEFGYLQAPLRCKVELSAFNHTASFPIKVGSQGVYSVPVYVGGQPSQPRIMKGCKMHYVPPMGNVDADGNYPERYVYDIANFKTSTRWAEGYGSYEIYVEANWTAQVVLINKRVSDTYPRWNIIEPPNPEWGGAAGVFLQLRLNAFEEGFVPPEWISFIPPDHPARRILPPGVTPIRTQTLPYTIDPVTSNTSSGIPIELTTLGAGEGWGGNHTSELDNRRSHYCWCLRQFRVINGFRQEAAHEPPSSIWFNHFRYGGFFEPFGVFGVEFPGSIVWESLWAPTA